MLFLLISGFQSWDRNMQVFISITQNPSLVSTSSREGLAVKTGVAFGWNEDMHTHVPWLDNTLTYCLLQKFWLSLCWTHPLIWPWICIHTLILQSSCYAQTRLSSLWVPLRWYKVWSFECQLFWVFSVQKVDLWYVMNWWLIQEGQGCIWELQTWMHGSAYACMAWWKNDSQG